MEVKEAIQILSETYLSLDAVALGLDVSQKDVKDAFSKAKEGTTEYVCLQALMKKYPVENKTTQEITKDGSKKQ